jgi:hypothetical protein
MMLVTSLGPTVTVVNRAVDEDGQPVPYEAHIDGQVIRIDRAVDLPVGIARIIVHHSMYRLDPVTQQAQYRLGVAEWGLPTDPLPPEEWQREELVDRANLGPARQHGAKDPRTGRRLALMRIVNPIRRHDPLVVSAPKPNQDGVHPGGFGEAFAR